MLDHATVRLVLADKSDDTVSSSTSTARQAALQAANAAYCPYSKRPFGVCLVFADGATVIGKNLENAAYNPGASASRSALGLASLQGHDLSKIKEAHGVEAVAGESVVTGHETELRELVRSLCPACSVHYAEARYEELPAASESP